MTVGSTSALSHSTLKGAETLPYLGLNKDVPLNRVWFWGVLTLKQAEGFKIGRVWYKQFS